MSNQITEDDFKTEEFDDDLSHQFNSEVKQKSNNKKLVAIGIAFIILMLLIIGGATIVKYKYEEWKAQNEADRLARDEASQSTSNRRDRSFMTDFFTSNESVEPTVIPDPEPAPVPQTFTQQAPAPDLPPIPLLENETTSSTVSTVPTKPKVFFDFPADSNNSTTFYGSVQDYATNQKSDNAPTATLQSSAVELGDRSFVIPRGAFIPCILETQLTSTIPGQANCIINTNIYSDDGSRLLISRGSSVVGSYGETVDIGDTRLAVVWERIKTNDGIVIDVDSGAADGVGTMGIGGHVNNRWGERIGAALLLSMIDDAVDIAISEQQSSGTRYGDSTSRSTKTLAEKVLDSTINIKPTITVNRGSRLM